MLDHLSVYENPMKIRTKLLNVRNAYSSSWLAKPRLLSKIPHMLRRPRPKPNEAHHATPTKCIINIV